LADLESIEPARSFDRAAVEYEQARPGYPEGVLDLLPLEANATVLDLGAGTGKLTRVLTSRYARVIAVEPLDGMRAILERVVPAAESLAGTAEAIPLPDASVDAVFAAQAFHWFANDDAIAEIARVLRPAGVLCVIWNESVAPSPLPEPYGRVPEDAARAVARHRSGSPLDRAGRARALRRGSRGDSRARAGAGSGRCARVRAVRQLGRTQARCGARAHHARSGRSAHGRAVHVQHARGRELDDARVSVRLVAAVFAALVLAPSASALQGRVIEDSFASKGLQSRLSFAVYLPPGYDAGTTRYPVVYYLHGLPADSRAFTSFRYVVNALELAHRQAIVVAPQGAHDGDTDAEYLDWSAGREWETAIAVELPHVVDNRYRTLPRRSARAILGVSAGGYGATVIGLAPP